MPLTRAVARAHHALEGEGVQSAMNITVTATVGVIDRDSKA